MLKYDVIVIGSGLGGLICGALLTKAGRKVCVLERSNQPGGCMQSYRRGNWMFDTGLHYVGGLNDGHPLHKAFKELGLMELPWQRMDKDFDHVIIGQREFSLMQGEEDFVDCLAKSFPSLRSNIQAYIDKLHNISSDDMDVNAWQWMKENLHDELLIDVVSASAMKIELRKGSLPLFSLLHSNKSYIESSWRLRGNGNMIVERLISSITNGGGEVRCHREAVRLKTCGDDIKCVTCSNGEEYTGDYFISDAHPAILSNMLDIKDRKNRTFSRRMKGCSNTYGVFTVQIVLKPDTLKYINHNIYIYKEHVWNPADTSEVGCVMVSCRCPEDGSEYARQIDIITPMKWGECLPWTDTNVGHRGESYQAMCERKVTECIQLAERAIPSLHSMVEKVYTSSPLTYRDYLAAPAGTAFGIRKDYEQSMLTFHSVKTPYRNLFQTGQSIILSGIEGVTMTALDTVQQINYDKSIKPNI